MKPLVIRGFNYTTVQVEHDIARGVIPEPFESWGINNSHDAYGYKPDAIVAMDDLRRDWNEHKKYVMAITTAGCPVYTATAYPEYPTTTAYPVREVLDFLGFSPPFPLGCKVLSNSWNYAIALGMYLGFKNIFIYGAEFVRPDSWWSLRRARKQVKDYEPKWVQYYRKPLIRTPTEPGLDGLNFLMGWATAKGIDITVPWNSTVLDFDRPDFLYGFQEQPYEYNRNR